MQSSIYSMVYLVPCIEDTLLLPYNIAYATAKRFFGYGQWFFVASSLRRIPFICSTYGIFGCEAKCANGKNLL